MMSNIHIAHKFIVMGWLTIWHWVFQDGWTPLHVAVQARRSDIVKLLVIKGADTEVKNKAS